MKNTSKLGILIMLIFTTSTSFAQGAEIAREIRGYLDAEVSGLKIEKKTATGETYYVRDASTGSSHHIGGGNTSNSTVVFDAFNSHPEWQDMSVVVDWTGSMYSYVGQVVRWHHVNKDRQLIHNMVLFNDGDDRLRQGGAKVVGSTGGIYFPNHLDIDDFLKTVAQAVDNGGGGDGPENDIEAILAAQSKNKGKKDFVLIADSSGIRDIELVNQIKRPVHVIICDNPTRDYHTLAQVTGGSITWPGGYVDYSNQQCGKRHVHEVVCYHH
ncbi:MAG: hypothetical protein NWQ09_01130 [Nonlabens sp.]|nr:hypothetical protein [Nonlabens sp.]